MDSTKLNIRADELVREILEKIFRQNLQMNAKFDKILSKQKILEKHIDKMKIYYKKTNVDKVFANVSSILVSS